MTQTHALVRTATGEILRFEDFELAAVPVLAEAKGLRWVKDQPPAFNGMTQTIRRSDTVPEEAETVPYQVDFRPDAEIAQAIRDEAYRRIVLIFSAGGNARDAEAKQRNLTAQATQLLRKGEANWTQQEAAAWAAGQALWDRVEALRADSNLLEASYAGMSDEQRAAFNPCDSAHWSF